MAFIAQLLSSFIPSSISSLFWIESDSEDEQETAAPADPVEEAIDDATGKAVDDILDLVIETEADESPQPVAQLVTPGPTTVLSQPPSPDANIVVVHPHTGFEYKGHHMERLYTWVFHVVQPYVSRLAFSITPRERPDDFCIVDCALQEPRIIGYIHIQLTNTTIRANFVPKGLRHVGSVLDRIEGHRDQFVARQIRAMATLKRSHVGVPIQSLSSNLGRAVQLVRGLRFSYVLSYWNYNLLRELFYIAQKTDDHEVYEDCQLIRNFKHWAQFAPVTQPVKDQTVYNATVSQIKSNKYSNFRIRQRSK